MRRLPFDYALRNLGRSPVRLAASTVGATLVVLLALAAAGFARGMRVALDERPRLHENVILLGAGSEEAIERSEIEAGGATILAGSVRGIASVGGVPLVSPEVLIGLPVRLAATDDRERQGVVRGVEPVALLVHPEVEIVEGRPPRAGADEIMAGALAAVRLGVPDDRLALGRTLVIAERTWTIVGRHRAPRTVMDAEIWMPLSDLQIATRRGSTVSCIVATLDPADPARAYAAVDLFARSRLDLELVAMRERDYERALSIFLRPVRLMVLVTAALVAVGGLLGGLNTTYAAFASRVREIGALQALGFARRAIVLSLLQESLLTAAFGAVVGAALGRLLLHGLAVRFSMGAFTLAIDAPVLAMGLGAGLVVGVVGAIPPAVRCLRLPIPEALRAVQ